jgi:hypothetical protein
MQSTTAPVPTPSAPPAKQPPQQMNGEAMQYQPVDEKKESPSADGYIQHEAPMHPVPPVVMNGGMPPQQVYVNNAMAHHHMAGLETQFQSLGMSEVQDVSHHDGEGDDTGEDGNDEDEPVKLFVGQVRKCWIVT